MRTDGRVCRRQWCDELVVKEGDGFVYCSSECGFVDRLLNPQPMSPLEAAVCGSINAEIAERLSRTKGERDGRADR